MRGDGELACLLRQGVEDTTIVDLVCVEEGGGGGGGGKRIRGKAKYCLNQGIPTLHSTPLLPSLSLPLFLSLPPPLPLLTSMFLPEKVSQSLI